MRKKILVTTFLFIFLHIANISFSAKTKLPHLIKLAEMSDNVYYSKKKIRAKYKHMKKVQIFTAGKVKVQFMLLLEKKGHKQIQYVAVRGTNNLKNIKTDLMARMVKDKKLGIKLHRGFKIASHAVYKYLKKHISKKIPIIVTGHFIGRSHGFYFGIIFKK